MMRFASLGSGSDGNATVICAGHTRILLDCGFSLKGLKSRLESKGVCPSSLTALLVTHEHIDHIRGAGALARRFNLPVYATQGTFDSGRMGAIPKPVVLTADTTETIGDIRIHIHAVPHDAKEPVQFCFEYDNKMLGILTDTGSMPDALITAYHDVDALVVEANYDTEMLARGPYPPSLKQRVGGHWGHLSNQQCAMLVAEQNFDRLQHLIIAHVSQKNNSEERVRQAFAHIPSALNQMLLASQDDGMDWRTIE